MEATLKASPVIGQSFATAGLRGWPGSVVATTGAFHGAIKSPADADASTIDLHDLTEVDCDEMPLPVVLGSRSPRRLELLRLLVPSELIAVKPPHNADEAGFDDLSTLPQFAQRILEIAHAKAADVLAQCGERPDEFVVLASDTTVVVEQSDGRKLSLGQPPEIGDWPSVVRGWFRDFYAGRTHHVLTGVVALRATARGVIEHRERTCVSSVAMRADLDRWLDWYIATREPLGKAGGYAIQGGGSLFVTRLEGSYSNVVGLPIEETLTALQELGACPIDTALPSSDVR